MHTATASSADYGIFHSEFGESGGVKKKKGKEKEIIYERSELQ